MFSDKDPDDFLEALSQAAIIIECWPPNGNRADVVAGLEERELFLDYLVAQQSIVLAREFIRDNADTRDGETESQVEALRYLISV